MESFRLNESERSIVGSIKKYNKKKQEFDTNLLPRWKPNPFDLEKTTRNRTKKPLWRRWSRPESSSRENWSGSLLSSRAGRWWCATTLTARSDWEARPEWGAKWIGRRTPFVLFFCDGTWKEGETHRSVVCSVVYCWLVGHATWLAMVSGKREMHRLRFFAFVLAHRFPLSDDVLLDCACWKGRVSYFALN